MVGVTFLDFIWLVPALPLLGAIVLLIFGKRIGEPRAGWIATGAMGASALTAIAMFAKLASLPSEERLHVVQLFEWFRAGSFRAGMDLLLDPLSAAFIVFITICATLIHLYSTGYMKGDPRYSRFFAYLNLFAASMLILILGANFLVTFLGWEGVGLCSYLLISFWFERSSAASAGKKAFITNRVGDFGFMIGAFLVFDRLGGIDYVWANPKVAETMHELVPSGTATAVALLLFVGAMGKSAQFPLHIWLPDAMEGPTPVSALIHAATMVTAGVYLVARNNVFFNISGSASTVVMWVGAITALYAATVALVQNDIKRILAYSTVSQLGYMFLALGAGAYGAAVFHVITHAFFKATLFLGAGSVIHANHHNQDIRTMGNMRKYMPITATAFGIAWLAIAGVFPFSGFWSKDEILAKTFHAGQYGPWVIGLIGAGLTAFYMSRQVFLVFSGNERFRDAHTSIEEGDAPAAEADPHHGEHEDAHGSPTVGPDDPPHIPHLEHDPHEVPGSMVFPVVVLAGLAAVGGLLALPFHGLEFLTEWLEPVFETGKHIEVGGFLQNALLAGVSLLIALSGIIAARAMYRQGIASPSEDPLPKRLGTPVRRFLAHAWFVDEGVAAAVDHGARPAATVIAEQVDQGVIDGAVRGTGAAALGLGTLASKLQNGAVRSGALGIAAGTVAVLLAVIVWFAQ